MNDSGRTGQDQAQHTAMNDWVWGKIKKYTIARTQLQNNLRQSNKMFDTKCCGRIKEERNSLVVFPFGKFRCEDNTAPSRRCNWYLRCLTICCHGNTTCQFAGSSLATWTRSWDHHNEMKKNDGKIHFEFITDAAVIEKCSWSKKWIKETEACGEKLSKNYHQFAFVCAVRLHIRYRTTAKSKTTQRTLELHGDVCKLCINE